MECDLTVLFLMLPRYYINSFSFTALHIMCASYVTRSCDKFNLKCKIHKILTVYLECNVCFNFYTRKIEAGDLKKTSSMLFSINHDFSVPNFTRRAAEELRTVNASQQITFCHNEIKNHRLVCQYWCIFPTVPV